MYKLFSKIVPNKLKFFIKSILNIFKNLKPIHKKNCPICGFYGFFFPFGRPLRNDAQCPSCNSLERHRLFFLMLEKKEIQILNTNSKILHFAPETFLINYFKKYPNYINADLNGNVDKFLNIENIDLPNNSYDIIIVNHVFEHVNDNKAFKEVSRILAKGGLLVATVPIVYGWERTYEENKINDDLNKTIHFGQYDHVRYYGSDFKDRVEKFSDLVLLKTFSLSKNDEIKYGLIRGEKIYLFQK